MYEEAESMDKGNYTEKIHKAENTLASNLKRSGPREIEICEEWLNAVSCREFCFCVKK